MNRRMRLLLIGLLAAAIPVALHLLASVRAPQAAFPTLRFLQTAMEQTARRRRVQHWLLLILRSLMLGLLALAVAEPISQAVGGWGREHTMAIVLDNSASMAVQTGGTSRFSRAQAQIANLLAGDDKPTRAALGFAKKQGITADVLTTVATEKGEYVGFKRNVRGKSAGELLADELPTAATCAGRSHHVGQHCRRRFARVGQSAGLISWHNGLRVSGSLPN